MRTRKIIGLLLLLVVSSMTAFGQRFQKEYTHPESLYPYSFVEANNHYTIQVTGTATSFLDLQIDKTGNGPVFQTTPVQLDFSSNWFIRAANGGIVSFSRYGGDTTQVQYLAPNGTLTWSTQIPITGDAAATAVSGILFKGVELNDGFVLLGSLSEAYAGGTPKKYLLAIKIDLSGNLVWQAKEEVTADLTYIYFEQVIADKIYFSWTNNETGYVSAITQEGVWLGDVQNTPGFTTILGLAPHTDGGIITMGYNFSNGTPLESFGRATCYDVDWNIRWQKTGWPELDYWSDIQSGGNYFPSIIIADGNGWVMSGYIEKADAAPFPFQRNLFLARLDSLGNIVTLKVYPTQQSVISTLAKTTDGGFFMSYYYLWNNLGHVGAIKTDTNLTAFPNLITGKAFQDPNLNCSPESNENSLSGWFLEVTNSQDTFYTLTNTLGEYKVPVDTGTYFVKIHPMNAYWEACDNHVQVYFASEDLIDTTDFALQPVVECPQMEVDVVLPLARRCFENTIFVNYCNNGTIAAPSAQIRLAIDPSLDFVSAGIPLSGIEGDTLIFNLAGVAVGECGQFWVKVLAECDSTYLGQTVCISAHISPDTICIPTTMWSGAQLEVGGFCAQDSVVFWVKNIGTAPTQALDYIIIEDVVVWRQGTFDPLQPNATDTIRLPATGTTYGLLAEQEPGYPYNGNIPLFNGPSAWVEACNWSGTLPFPGGIVTQFPNEDGNPAVATDCSVITGSFDPNDKHASPEGVTNQHFILPGTPIEYIVRFQNTGTDTAFNVVIRDDLSSWLDPSTLQLSATSHPCTMEMELGDNIKFTFENILLPDSTTNLAGSQGFVKYTVRPYNHAPIGSIIENTAAIFFDFNAPVYTNTYFHTIDTNFVKKEITQTSSPVELPSIGAQIFPNPCHSGAVICIQGHDYTGFTTLFDVSGKSIAVIEMKNGKTQLPQNLPSGLYLLKTPEGQVVRLAVL